MPRSLPLDGVRVLELGSFIAAPTAGRQLADFGADVVKIERPGLGDELRNWRLYAGSTSMLYRTINRNKRSAAVDLRTEEGRDLVLELAGAADVVLENFRPGRLEAWGLGPEDLSARNPELILARISAFGQTGPKSAQPGFGAIAEALGGMRELTGEPGRAPVRVGVSIGDTLAGMHAAFGVLLALRERDARRRDGARPLPLAERIVDVALTEAVLSVMESLLPDAVAYGVQRERLGGWTQGIAPSNAYLCGDGRSVVIAGNGDGIYLRLMEVIGRSDLGAREDLSSNALRWAARAELDAAITAWTSQQAAPEVVAALDAVGVPASLIYTAADIAADAQFVARGAVQRMRVSTGEEELDDVPFPGVVPRLGPDAGVIDHLGPDLGAHTDEVVHDWLGRDAAPTGSSMRETVR
jgi:formyl-CoA transferase